MITNTWFRVLSVVVILLALGFALVQALTDRQGAAMPIPPTAIPTPPRPFVYVALGDSTVFGQGASGPDQSYVALLSQRLGERYPDTRTRNLGIGGATAADVVDAQLDAALAAQPNLVTLSVGPNDITQGRDVADYERDLATIFGRLRMESDAVLVVNSLPDIGVAPRLTPQQRALASALSADFNAALERQARKHEVVVVDLFTASREQVPGHPELLAGDGYHPSDAGYARWAELMWRGIEPNLR